MVAVRVTLHLERTRGGEGGRDGEREGEREEKGIINRNKVMEIVH